MESATDASPTFFATPAEWRAWLAEHHATADELLVGFHKVGTGLPSLTWPQSVDEALCFGWIDGVRRSLGKDAYTIRFTPRRPRSIWSAVNVARVAELTASGRMTPAGLAAFARRTPERTGVYSFERGAIGLGEEFEALFRANAAAWAFWEAQPPSYRKPATWWVISAKKEETRRSRLATLVEDSAAGRRIALLVSSKAKG